MSHEKEHELRVFQLLADTIGETLEQVYQMQDLERRQLITALGIDKAIIKVDITDDEEEEQVVTAMHESFKHVKLNKARKLDDDTNNDEIRVEGNTETIEVKDEGGVDTELNNNNQPAFVFDESVTEVAVHPALVSLKKDTELVIRILGPDKKFTPALVEAYLEAHMNKQDRVQVVVEELAEMAEEVVEDQIFERQLSLEKQIPLQKGKGKSGKHTMSDGIQLGGKRSYPFPATREEAGKMPRIHEMPRVDNDEEVEKVDGDEGVTLAVTPVPAVDTDVPDEIEKKHIEKPEETDEAGAKIEIPTVSLLDSPPLVLAGSTKAVVDTPDHTAISLMVDSLSDMFPDTPLEYLRARCPDLIGKEAALERFTEELLKSQTPPPNWRQIYLISKEENTPSPGPSGLNVVPSSSSSTAVPCGPSTSSIPHPLIAWEADKLGELQSLFPTISPQYLEEKVHGCSRVEGRLVDHEVTQGLNIAFQHCVEHLFSLSPDARSRLPTRAQWQIQMKEKAELEKWSGNLSPSDFLDVYEDPIEYFNSKRKVSEDYKTHAIADLKGRFRFQSVTKIKQVFRQCGFMLTPSVQRLKHIENTRSTERQDHECRTAGVAPSIDFLKEKKFLELENDIKAEKTRRVKEKEDKIVAGRQAGNLVECECCYSSECLLEDMVRCGGGHVYCTECVETSTKVAMGEGRTEMECLGQCNEEISWQELSRALKPNVLSKLIQKRQAVEVEKAEVENVVACPYCPYLTIMDNVADKVLVCKNPECGRESCRLCKEPNHIPLRCEEVEKGEETRKKIEERLT